MCKTTQVRNLPPDIQADRWGLRLPYFWSTHALPLCGFFIWNICVFSLVEAGRWLNSYRSVVDLKWLLSSLITVFYFGKQVFTESALAGEARSTNERKWCICFKRYVSKFHIGQRMSYRKTLKSFLNPIQIRHGLVNMDYSGSFWTQGHYELSLEEFILTKPCLL